MSADRVKIAVVAALAALLGLTLALRALVPADAVTPAVVSLLFVAAAGIALIGISLRSRLNGTSCLNAAAVLVYAGVMVSIMIDPDQLLRLVVPAGQPE